ncbi:hypothetical protein AB1N83_005145 [Pleurotus pulmonarius]
MPPSSRRVLLHRHPTPARPRILECARIRARTRFVDIKSHTSLGARIVRDQRDRRNWRNTGVLLGCYWGIGCAPRAADAGSTECEQAFRFVAQLAYAYSYVVSRAAGWLGRMHFGWRSRVGSRRITATPLLLTILTAKQKDGLHHTRPRAQHPSPHCCCRTVGCCDYIVSTYRPAEFGRARGWPGYEYAEFAPDERGISPTFPFRICSDRGPSYMGVDH